jgi:hypothetical protein
MMLLAFSFAATAEGQTTPSKIYRGATGDKHIEMRLNIDGSKVTGTYFYDQFKPRQTKLNVATANQKSVKNHL